MFSDITAARMGERQIRHVGHVFGEEIENRKPSNMLDRKTSFNVFKNKQAPKPPQGSQALPKIGNYQPKIFLEPKTSDYGGEHRSDDFRTVERHQAEVHEVPSSFKNSAPKAMIIGDKDELLRIEDEEREESVGDPVAPPRRKRRAPEAPELGPSSNPVFGRSISQRSDEEKFEMDFEEQGGDIDFAEGIDNPAFNSRARSESGSSYRRRAESSSTHRNSHNEHTEDVKRPHSVGGTSYPYIPPPDYEDEEVTIDFDEEAEEFLDPNKKFRNTNAYRELEGDDFGKYLDEDDYEFDVPRRPRPPSMSSKSRPAPSPLKPKYNKQHENIKSNKKAGKAKKRQEKREANLMKRNTIRDFTFSDSKIGWGDRTVKSTSAKGRYIKREKERKRLEHEQPILPGGGPGSYEEFLRVTNGIPLESPNSSDSGVEMSEESRIMEDMYMKNQPKQLRHGQYDRKPSFLQRLTWRFRKNVTVTRQESASQPEPETYDYKF